MTALAAFRKFRSAVISKLFHRSSFKINCQISQGLQSLGTTVPFKKKFPNWYFMFRDFLYLRDCHIGSRVNLLAIQSYSARLSHNICTYCPLPVRTRSAQKEQRPSGRVEIQFNRTKYLQK
jgi:hypothetical protein